MHIAKILQSLAEASGGPAQVAAHSGAEIEKLGHKVSYWGTDVMPGPSMIDDQQHDVNVYPISWPRGWMRSPELAHNLQQRIKDIDLLHIYYLWTHPVFASVRAAQKANKPCMVHLAGSLEPWRLRNTPFKRLKKKAYLETLGRYLFNRVDCLHVTTEVEEESARIVGYKGPIARIPLGTDPQYLIETLDGNEAEQHWPELKDRFVILFLSRISKEKGIDTLIESWAELSKQPAFKDALLVIAGPDDRGYKNTVDAMVEHFNLAHKILFTGMVQGRKKQLLYTRADIFVLPSYSENFAIVIPEAMACSTPVITTTGTPWKIMADHNAGYWIEPNCDALTDALKQMVALPESERQKIGQAGRKLVEDQFSWEKITLQLIKTYENLITGKTLS